MLRGVYEHWSGRAGLILLAVLLLVAVAGPWLVPYDSISVSGNESLQPPNSAHWLGTDQLGRDQLARIVDAIPVAFATAAASVVLAAVVGGLMGVIAGMRGRIIERLIMAGNDIMLSMPALLMAIVVVGVFGGGFRNTVLAISLIYLPRFARVTRGSTLEIKGLPYVDAARLSGTGGWLLGVRHIIPALLPPVIVMATLSLSTAVLTQSALSFLGLGVQPPTPDLGRMLANSVDYMSLGPWLMVAPSLVIVMMILGFNLVGDAVRDVIDPTVDRRTSSAAQ